MLNWIKRLFASKRPCNQAEIIQYSSPDQVGRIGDHNQVYCFRPTVTLDHGTDPDAVRKAVRDALANHSAAGFLDRLNHGNPQ